MSNNDLVTYNKEELVEMLLKLQKNKTYGIVWEEKPEEFDINSKNKLAILREINEKQIQTDVSKQQQILIEGDNYHALTCLSYTHKEKIDLIYIDPPYNTGSNDFLYNDNYVDKNDKYRHSKWLSFMYKRLKLSRDLLKPTGVIFISINEDELCQLKLICDDIFRPENYLTMFTIKVRHEDRILKGDKDFHEVVEYLLMYRKSSLHKTTKRIVDNTSNAEYVYEIIEKIDNPETMKCGSKEVSIFKPGEYEIIKHEPSIDLVKKINIRGSLKEGNSSGRFYMKYLDPLKHMHGYLFKVPNMGEDKFPHRYFLTPTSDKKANGDYFQGVPMNREDTKPVPYPNYYDFEQDFNNVGYEGDVDFRNGKKPINFLLKIFEMSGITKNSIILDFFAGSGSTAHAVLELNKRDGGNRQVIICTNNENNICTEKTYPRIKKAIEGYEINDKLTKVLYESKMSWNEFKKAEEHLLNIAEVEEQYKDKFDKIEKQLKNDTLRVIGKSKNVTHLEGCGGNLKYYITDFIGEHNIKGITDNDKIILAQNVGDMIAIRENTLIKVEENEWYQIYSDGHKLTTIYFREDVDRLLELKNKIIEISKPTSIYIFSWGKNEYVSDFQDINNIRIEDIPEPILKVYRNIYRGL